MQSQYHVFCHRFSELDSQDGDCETVWEGAVEAEIVSRLQKLMQKGKHGRALFLLKDARAKFADSRVFGGADVDDVAALKVVFLAAATTTDDQAKMEELSK